MRQAVSDIKPYQQGQFTKRTARTGVAAYATAARDCRALYTSGREDTEEGLSANELKSLNATDAPN